MLAYRLARTFLLLAGTAVILAAGCNNEDAILLMIRPPAGVQLNQYEVKIQDRASRTLIYQSGIQPVAAVTSGRDLSAEPLRIGLKLSQAGSFLVFVRGSTGTLAPDGTRPANRTSEYFFATITQTSGTTEIDGSLLEVEPEFDRDFDHFPDAVTWTMADNMAKARYQLRPEVLDCVDVDPGPKDPQLPAGLFAVQINPLAKPRCGLSIDVSCGPMAPACKDADGDGENESTDCDDNDANRFHGNPRPRNCCTCTDHDSCAKDHSKLQNLTACQPARCDSSTDFDCTGVVVPCFVDEDCDGYSPNDPVPSQRDCDDSNPNVYPGAPKNCSDASHDWACDGNPRGGCVSCDLDGDGYQRSGNGCPDTATDAHPGKTDCNDDDRGVFPGSTSYNGATLLIQDLKGMEGGGSVAAALRGLCRNTAVDGVTKQDADCDNKPSNGCPPAMSGGKVCDADGDGFPGAGVPAGCIPAGVTLPVDCDDTDPHTFPGAPAKCGSLNAKGLPWNCASQVPCTMDKDGDGYNSDVDCDDNNAARHPWATESCNGVDDDCDGLIDELNPDDTGARLVETQGGVTSIKSCTDNNAGSCGLKSGGFYSGRCVCTGVVPGGHATSRTACPGTRDDGTTAPKCFGATQPGKQTCKASTINTADEDCDGRTDAPDGANLKDYNNACGVTTPGACVAGKVVGCDKTKINPFSQLTNGHAVSPPFDPERKYLVCDNTAVYPSTDVCDGKDNDCDGTIDDCTGAGITTPKCCPMVNMCLDLNSDFGYCGSCSNACNLATANKCQSGNCMCGANPACSGARGLCKGGMSCVQCLLDNDCNGVTGKPRCKGADSCVECIDNSDCKTAPNLACNTNTNTCVPCFQNSDCSDPLKPICDTGNGYVCRGCVTSANCTAPTPICDTGNGYVCRGCLSNANCMTPTAICDTGNGYVCRQCVMNTDCTDPTRPVCDTMGGYVCKCKASADCKAPTPVCDTGNGSVCRECLDSATDCKDPAKPVCDTGNGYVCRECVNNGDCTDPTKPKCLAGTHTCGCSAVGDCGMTYTMCNMNVCM